MKILHIVLFKLSKSTDQRMVERVTGMFRDCVGVVDGLEWVQSGKNHSESKYALGWDLSVLMLFRDRESRDIYLPHPRHRQITEVVSDGFYSDLVVFDQEVDPVQMFGSRSSDSPARLSAESKSTTASSKTKTESDVESGQPVSGFPMEFEWHTGDLKILFDRQVALIKSDIDRAKDEDKIVVYLSCPISSRGGGNSATNVEIAKHTQRRLMDRWGHRFWILNPAMYQMESKEGRGLIRSHARDEWGDDAEHHLRQLPKTTGGDYLRMWTKVLVEDPDELFETTNAHLGRNFDAFYFLGPTDVHDFFCQGGAKDVTAAVEEYFARAFTMDPDFRDAYSIAEIEWDANRQTPTDTATARQDEQRKKREEWENRRKRFFRFYALRASANFSLGSHDEWNILVNVNKQRMKFITDGTTSDVGELLAAYFDGGQIDPARP